MAAKHSKSASKSPKTSKKVEVLKPILRALPRRTSAATTTSTTTTAIPTVQPKVKKAVISPRAANSIEAVQFGSLKESSLIYDKTGIDALFAQNATTIKTAIADIKTISELQDDVTLYDVKVVANKLVLALQSLYDNL